MNKEKQKEHIGFFGVSVILLTVFTLLALLIDTIFDLPDETSRILNVADNIICGIFLLEFIYHLYKAPDKWKFMKWGWIDLVASIPAVGFLRVGRLLRLVRLLRIVRAFNSMHEFIAAIFRNRVRDTIVAAILVAFFVIIFSSIAILQVEHGPQVNIRNAEDALWWSYVTVTTVGYGDKYPVTGEGRIIAAVLMTVGVGLFGTFTGYVSSFFLGGRKKQKEQGNS